MLKARHATSQDSIAAQGYLQSQDQWVRLDQDIGFRDQFSAPIISPCSGLISMPPNRRPISLQEIVRFL